MTMAFTWFPARPAPNALRQPWPWFILALACLLVGSQPPVQAQSRPIEIQARYHAVPLEDVLQDLSRRYGLRFAYSPQYLPMKQAVTLHLPPTPMADFLKQLFAPLPIRYQLVGQQIVLRYAPKPVPGALQPRELPEEATQQSPIYPDTRLESVHRERQQRIQEELPVIQRMYAPLPATQAQSPSSENQLPQPMPTTAGSRGGTRLAQVSLLPYIGTNPLQAYRTANRVSLNLLWGLNGGVNGLEAGGLVNRILYNVHGIQLAGAANLVAGSVTGVQFSGLGNWVGDTLQGLQLAGLFNRAETAYAVQASGLFNYSRGPFAGVQASGGVNVCQQASTGIQVAGIGNLANGQIRMQSATLFNVAEEVEGGQLSLLYNKARHVRFQAALINQADTIDGIPLGLLNLIRSGYNRFEIAGSETFHTSFAVKLGVPAFYNIFFLGTQMPRKKDQRAIPSWGIGYGLGTTIQTGMHRRLTMELLSTHINEQALWTPGLHQLQQLRMTLDVPIYEKISFFFGPTIQLLLTNRQDSSTGNADSNFPPYTWYRSEISGRPAQLWWGGFSTGVRFW